MYLAVFLQVPGASLGWAAINALANVAPLALLAAGAHLLIKHWVMRLSVAAQVIAHTVIGAGFAAAWFALVTIALALIEMARSGAFALSGFTGRAFIWQNLQGLVHYWALAATTYAVRMSLGEFEQRLDPQRFIRVHRSQIINIDHLDYAEPADSGRLVARMTDGTAVPLSQTGSQALRSLIV